MYTTTTAAAATWWLCDVDVCAFNRATLSAEHTSWPVDSSCQPLIPAKSVSCERYACHEWPWQRNLTHCACGYSGRNCNRFSRCRRQLRWYTPHVTQLSRHHVDLTLCCVACCLLQGRTLTFHSPWTASCRSSNASSLARTFTTSTWPAALPLHHMWRSLCFALRSLPDTLYSCCWLSASKHVHCQHWQRFPCSQTLA